MKEWHEWIGVKFRAHAPFVLPGNVPVAEGDIFELDARDLAPVANGGGGVRPELWIANGGVTLYEGEPAPEPTDAPTAGWAESDPEPERVTRRGRRDKGEGGADG